MENVFDYPYYRVTKVCLQCLGHWPFQSSRKKRYLRCFTIFVIFSILIPKIIKFFESFNDLDVMFECLPILGCHGLGLVKFFNWIFMEDHMKRLLLIIERDWKSLTTQSDIDLLHQHSERARKLNILYASFIYGTLLLYFCSPAVPLLLDYFKPLNETRARIFLYQTEYFVDQEEHYIAILLHAYTTIPVALACIICFDNLFGTFINHACGMFEILRSHLENIHITKTNDSFKNSIEDYIVIKSRIKYCSDLQTQTFQFVDDLEASYNIALLIVVGINMALIVFAGMLAVIKISHPNEMIRISAINMGAVYHLFWISWLGHILVVQSERIFYSVYQSEWYRLPCRLQLMLMPLMAGSAKPCQLTAGKLYIMSMESFGAALRTIMSFFTVLNSMR